MGQHSIRKLLLFRNSFLLCEEVHLLLSGINKQLHQHRRKSCGLTFHILVLHGGVAAVRRFLEIRDRQSVRIPGRRTHICDGANTHTSREGGGTQSEHRPAGGASLCGRVTSPENGENITTGSLTEIKSSFYTMFLIC